jgi:hypothetical protein
MTRNDIEISGIGEEGVARLAAQIYTQPDEVAYA